MILAMRDLLIEKGVVTAEQIRRGFETLDSWQPSRGAQIVARAWTDPAFKARLLDDGNAAIAEFGIAMGEAKLTVVENTETVQNVIVCTLCSCYPRAILGLPPDWYRSKSTGRGWSANRVRCLKELGTELPDDMTSAFTTAWPICAISCCPGVRPAPRDGPRSGWRRSSPGIAWSASPIRPWRHSASRAGRRLRLYRHACSMPIR